MKQLKRKSMIKAFVKVVAILALFALAPLVLAQVRPVGQIVGTVQDPTGAVIPGAEVTLQD